MRDLAGFVAWLVAIIGIVIMVIGFLNRESLSELFVLGIALAVAAIPEGLVVAVTVILTIGMNRILKRHSLVRNLLAAETARYSNL